jgi:hypothetical protein
MAICRAPRPFELRQASGRCPFRQPSTDGLGLTQAEKTDLASIPPVSDDMQSLLAGLFVRVACV